MILVGDDTWCVDTVYIPPMSTYILSSSLLTSSMSSLSMISCLTMLPYVKVKISAFCGFVGYECPTWCYCGDEVRVFATPQTYNGV